MSKKFRSQASSSRAASALGGFGSFATSASPISYVAELPDLSQIPDPNVVVSFKNLSKRDSTTKAKALEELTESLKSNVDPAVLTAWSQLYPRTSIDNSQKVRRLAHSLQGTLAVNATKKIVPLLPQIIPSWLAGLYDNDKSVSKSASDALERTFTSFEKRKALWTIYKDHIYERVEDALLTQSANTLSDERTTSADEAELKYVRVLGTALYLLSNLIQIHHDHPAVLNKKRFWDLAYHDDSWVRTGLFTVANAVFSDSAKELDWPLVSNSFISKALQKSQMGSARAFVDTLSRLTKRRPSIWTIDYTAKTAASKRLMQFLKLGVQGGPPDTWILLQYLLKEIPVEVLKTSSDQCGALAEALRQGVIAERIAVSQGWSTYSQICFWLAKDISNDQERQDFFQANLVPIVRVYIEKPGNENWRLGPKPEVIATGVLRGLALEAQSSCAELWSAAVDNTVEKMRLLLPENAKDFNLSQDSVSAQSARLAVLRGVLLNKAEPAHHDKPSLTHEPDERLLHSALELLRSRNGKPYGAAAIVDDLAQQGYANDEQLQQFLDDHVTSMIESPSASHLISICRACNKSMAKELLSQDKHSPYGDEAIRRFLSTCTKEEIKDDSIRDLVLKQINQQRSESKQALSVALLSNQNLVNDSLQLNVLTQIIDGLSVDSQQRTSLDILDNLLVSSRRPKVLDDDAQRSSVTTKLLVLSDGESSLAERAASINVKLGADSRTGASSVPIIKQQLSGDAEPLSILTLVDLATNATSSVNITEILPSDLDWDRALEPHLHVQLGGDLSVTSPLHGMVGLISRGPNQGLSASLPKYLRDKEDFSLLFRLTYYTTKLIKIGQESGSLTSMLDQTISKHYPIALQLLNDKLTADYANDLWNDSTPDLLDEASEILSQGNQLIQGWLADDVFTLYWIEQIHKLSGNSPSDYLLALTCYNVLDRLTAESPRKMLQEFDTELKYVHKSEMILQSCTLLAGLREPFLSSPTGTRVLNELIASATSAKVDQAHPIVLLNLMIDNDNGFLTAVPQQRLVFLLKHLLDMSTSASEEVKTEIIKLLTVLVPAVREIYGEHWEQLVQLTAGTVSTESSWTLAIFHAKLRLFAELQKAMRADDVNEDLEEAWQANKEQLQHALLSMLQYFDTPTLAHSQPKTIVAELLRRQVATVDWTTVTSADEDKMFSLIDLLESTEPAIQSAVFGLLHSVIPTLQEQRSIDLALEQKTTHLPTLLLRLISNDSVNSRQYLLSWKLIFDHWTNASYKLQELYSADLKESGHLNKLLDSLCNHLRLTTGRPIEASRFDVTNYTGKALETEEKDIQHLAVHMTYLALLLVPNLVKDWYLEQKNRIKTPLESWTQKYMTPLITSTALTTVATWATSQSTDPTAPADHPLDIKTSPQARELTASIPIDPESPAISLTISLPLIYPLDSPTVTSRTRVGVSEKKWESWLRTFQIIIFSSGSIIEGLIAFRRNVAGALKGQTECAICYSIIGTDMQTPSKRCGTCRNMFHGSCLFRWFRSSNSSSCPLCRNNFNYA